MHDEREFLSRYGIRSLSKLHEAQPFEFERPPRGVRAGRVGRRSSRAATRTGAGRSGSRRRSSSSSRCASSAPRSAPRYLVADAGLGRSADRAPGDGARHRPPDDRHLPARQEPAAAGVRRRAEVRRRSATGAITCCSTSTSTATTAPASARATRPGGPRWSRT